MRYLALTFGTSVVLLNLVGGATPATSKAPSMCSGWKKVEMEPKACIERAKAALAKQFSDIGEGTEPGEVYGLFRNYIGLVNCGAVGQQVVFFVTSGPEEKVCHGLWKALQDRF